MSHLTDSIDGTRIPKSFIARTHRFQPHPILRAPDKESRSRSHPIKINTSRFRPIKSKPKSIQPVKGVSVKVEDSDIGEGWFYVGSV